MKAHRMIPIRQTLLFAFAAVLATGAFADEEFYPQAVQWMRPGDEKAVTELEARAVSFGFTSMNALMPTYALVDLRNLSDRERTLDVSLIDRDYSSGDRRFHRAVTIPPHGSVHLPLPSPGIPDPGRMTCRIEITERTGSARRIWNLICLGINGDNNFDSVNALITGSFSREQLAKSLTPPQKHDDQPRSRARAGEGARDYPVNAFKCQLPFDGWPTDWRAYLSFDAVFLTPEEHSSLPSEVGIALDGYRAHGGLVFVIAPTPAGGIADGCAEIRNRIRARKEIRINSAPDSWSRSLRLGDLIRGVKLDNISPVPLGLILTLLAVFCLGVIPAVILTAIRRNRRIMLFATIPAASLLITVIIIASIILTFGFTPTVRVQSVTWLDQSAKTAATRGTFAVRSPLSTDGRITVDSDASFSLLEKKQRESGLTSELTDRYRLDGGWVTPLVPTYFAFSKYGRCRARLDIAAEADGSLTVANLLGAPVTCGAIRFDGKLYPLSNLAPGARTSVRPSDTKFHDAPPLDYEQLVRKDTAFGNDWDRLVALADETDRLRDGTYAVRLDGCPFLSPPFGERKVKGSSAAIVIGDFSGEVGK